MKVSEWLKKANKLLETCEYQISIKNGSKPITMSEAKTLNELQVAIGSNHGIRQVKYKEAEATLIEMIAMVEAGQKTPPLTPG